MNSDEETFQKIKTSDMEESADPEEAPHPVANRTPVAGHHGVRDGHVQVVGAARRVQHGHQIRTVSHFGAAADNGLQTQVSRVQRSPELRCVSERKRIIVFSVFQTEFKRSI